jgi:putative transposase
MGGSGYKIFDQEGLYFITFSVVEWVDVFTRAAFADIIVDGLNFCISNKGLNVHAWVLMPNHFHGILSAQEGFEISGILRDFKRHTSKKIIAELKESVEESRKRWMTWIFKSAGDLNSRNKGYQFWQQDNHPVFFRQFRDDSPKASLHS